MHKKREERPKRGTPWKPVAGIIATIAAFSLTLLALNVAFGQLQPLLKEAP